jgi:hypothetical protein
VDLNFTYLLSVREEVVICHHKWGVMAKRLYEKKHICGYVEIAGQTK